MAAYVDNIMITITITMNISMNSLPDHAVWSSSEPSLKVVLMKVRWTV